MIFLRPYEPRDWQRLNEIHDAARVGELTGAGLMEAYLTLEETYENEGLFDNPVLVAEWEGQVAGFIAASAEEITWLYVDPAYQRKGIAKALVARVIEEGGDVIELEVLDGNQSAIGFYESMGFKRVSSSTGHLAGNEAFTATGHMMEYHKE